jgi:hypothetical protein
MMADNVWVNPAFSAQRANRTLAPWDQLVTGEELDRMTGEEMDASDRSDRAAAVEAQRDEDRFGPSRAERAPLPPAATGASPWTDSYEN